MRTSPASPACIGSIRCDRQVTLAPGGRDNTEAVPGSTSSTAIASRSGSLKRGSTIPVKVQIFNCGNVAVAGLAPTISLVKLASTTTSDADTTAVPTSVPDTGNLMRWSASGAQYIYNLSTKRSSFNGGADLDAGQYQVTATEASLPGGSVTAYFQLVK